MSDYHFNSFFDLTAFAHSALFEGTVHVWEALNRLEEFFNNSSYKIESDLIHPSLTLVHPKLVSIGEGSDIGAAVQIEGPCIIGRNCQIRHGAYIRPFTLIGDGCVIGHATEVKSSIFLNGAKAPHFNYVGDSILGEGVNLGAGVICANFRLDGAEIFVRHEKEKTATGRHKLGAIIGDRSSISCHTVLNPGTCLPPDYQGGAQYRLVAS